MMMLLCEWYNDLGRSIFDPDWKEILENISFDKLVLWNGIELLMLFSS